MTCKLIDRHNGAAKHNCTDLVPRFPPAHSEILLLLNMQVNKQEYRNWKLFPTVCQPCQEDYRILWARLYRYIILITGQIVLTFEFLPIKVTLWLLSAKNYDLRSVMDGLKLGYAWTRHNRNSEAAVQIKIRLASKLRLD